MDFKQYTGILREFLNGFGVSGPFRGVLGRFGGVLGRLGAFWGRFGAFTAVCSLL